MSFYYCFSASALTLWIILCFVFGHLLSKSNLKLQSTNEESSNVHCAHGNVRLKKGGMLLQTIFNCNLLLETKLMSAVCSVPNQPFSSGKFDEVLKWLFYRL